MKERRKEPREGSEIEPETACIQAVEALELEIEMFLADLDIRVQTLVTAYLLYNGSASDF